MAFVATATLVGGGSALLGGALIGAGVGGLYSAVTGDGDILNSMLTGGLLGGAAGGIGAAMAPNAAVASASPFYTAAPTATAVKTAVPAAATAGGSMGGISAGGAFTPTVGSAAKFTLPAAGMTGGQMLATGLAGTTALSLLGNKKGGIGQMPDAGYIRPYTYSSTPVPAGDEYPSPYPSTPLYNAQGNPILDTRERNYFDQTFTAGEPYKAANGGLMAAYQAGGPVERMSMMNTAMNPQGGLYPMGMIDKTQYATPTQRPVSSELMMDEPAYNRSNPMLMAKGGKTEDDDESYKDRMKRIKEMSSMLDEIRETGRVAPPDLGEYVPTMKEYKPSKLNLMASPQGFINPSQRNELMEMTETNPMGRNNQMMGGSQTKGIMGRLGAAYNVDRDTQLMGGISGFAGRDRGEFTVKPNMLDLGVARRMGPGTLAAQYQRSLTGQQPPRYMANYSIPYADGGDVQGYNLGGYSDGGRLLRGPGDGVSDDIPATIGDRQPARLADGEFVIPARIVSELGNGSTDAGAKRLYAMMDRIQSGRKKTIGKGNVAKDTKAKKHLLA
jgi:hypothetical protein